MNVNPAKLVQIGSNVWIGADAIVVEGVVISNNCIVEAGLIVTSNLESKLIYAGIPYRKKAF